MSDLMRVVDGRLVPAAGTWELDPGFTTIEFTVRRLLTRLHGWLSGATGTIVIDDDPLKSVVDLAIPTGTLRTSHPGTDEAVRGDEFLNVEQYPELLFRSTRVEPTESDHWAVTGDLTIRDVSRPVTLATRFIGAAQHPFGGMKKATFEAQTVIDRREFGIDGYQVPVPGSAGVVVVGNEISITLDVEADLTD